MSKGKLYLGKINVMKIDKARLFKGEKGTYMDVTIWVNDEPDQFGRHVSIQQSTKKDEDKIYLGDAKFYDNDQKSEPQSGTGDDMPF